VWLCRVCDVWNAGGRALWGDSEYWVIRYRIEVERTTVCPGGFAYGDVNGGVLMMQWELTLAILGRS